MSSSRMVTQQDVRRIRLVAIFSIVALAAAGVERLLIPRSIAPRVNVRWAAGVDDAERGRLESRLHLLAGERREGTTWAYDLGDPSWAGVRALVTEPGVADTHYINRRFGIVASDAPQGSTRLSGGVLGAWRDSGAAGWTIRIALSLFVVSGLWLLTTGRKSSAIRDS